MNNLVQKTAYHIDNGPQLMYAVDADSAVARHPEEWSHTPWSVDDTNAWREQRWSEQAEANKSVGLPEPPKPNAIELSPQVREELDADAQARQEAYELVEEYEAKRREEREYEERVAAARSLLATPAPVPTEQRRPTVAQPAPGKVEIPNDWRDQGPQKRRMIAIRLGAPNTVKSEDADKLIEAEQARRAAAGDGGAQAPNPPDAPQPSNPQAPSGSPPTPQPLSDQPQPVRRVDEPPVEAPVPVPSKK